MSPAITKTQDIKAASDLETRPLWTVDEVAKYLCLGPETVRSMARESKIPCIKIGRGWRFRSSEIKAWLKTHHSQDGWDIQHDSK